MQVFSQTDGRCLDQIRLRDLHVRCTIGLYPDEALRTQPLTLQLSLFLNTRKAALDGRLASTVDYAALTRELNFILSHGRFRLLESAAEALASYILSEANPDQLRSRIEAVELEIIKPEALRGAAIPSVRIFRQERQTLDGPLIFAAPEAAILRFVLPPHASHRLRFADWHLRALLPVEGGLAIDGRDLAGGEEIAFDKLEESFISNRSDAPRSVLGIAARDLKAKSARPQAQDLVQSPFYN